MNSSSTRPDHVITEIMDLTEGIGGRSTQEILDLTGVLTEGGSYREVTIDGVTYTAEVIETAFEVPVEFEHVCTRETYEKNVRSGTIDFTLDKNGMIPDISMLGGDAEGLTEDIVCERGETVTEDGTQIICEVTTTKRTLNECALVIRKKEKKEREKVTSL